MPVALAARRVGWAPALLAAAFATLAIGLLGLGAGVARAGGWTLVSCTAPDGQPAPTDGWSAGAWAGGSPLSSGATNTCATGGSLTAISSSAGAALADTGPEWVFGAPAGATIAGGEIAATLTAPQGQAWIGTPQPAFDAGDVLAACGLGGACGSAGTLTGTFPIVHPGGNRLYAPAICVPDAPSLPSCALGAGSPNAEVAVKAAHIELAVDATPTGSDFGGGLLDGRAHGVADLSFLAADPGVGGGSGPGVYDVTVLLDGRTVYAGEPDDDRGTCVPLGTDPATGGLMFDRAQPCARNARISIPVTTTGLSDGRHTLSVAVGDAAGDQATVLQRTITTFNPTVSPAPAPGVVPARLTVGWTFTGGQTTIDSVSTRGLPARGRLAARCRGERCPAFVPTSVPVVRAGRLWTALRAARFTAGEQLRITASAPHRRAEVIRYAIRAGRVPSQRLLR